MTTITHIDLMAVRNAYEAVRKSHAVERHQTLVTAVEELILAVDPDAKFKPGWSPDHGSRVYPDLLANDRLAVWVTASRLNDSWKWFDRDALITNRTRPEVTPVVLVLDVSAEDDNAAAAAAVRAARRFASNAKVLSARYKPHMREFIKLIEEVSA